MESLPFILSLLVVLFAVYWYFLKYHNVFKKHGVPYVPFLPIVGNGLSLATFRHNFLEMLQHIYDFHPEAKYVGFYELHNPDLLIRDVDLIKSICVTNFQYFRNRHGFAKDYHDPLMGNSLVALNGYEWKNARSSVTPSLTTSKIKGLFAMMSRSATTFADFVSKLPEKQRDLELKGLLSKYTIDVMANSTYGLNIDSINDPNNLFYVNSRKSATLDGFVRTVIILLNRNVPWLGKVLRFRLVQDKIDNFFFDTILSNVSTRDQEGIYKPDILQVLMNARYKKGPRLTIDQIHHQAFAFLFGGAEFGSTQLSFLLHHLAVNPDVQRRLQREIDGVLEDTEGQLTYDAIMDMEYIDAVVNEGLRMNPVLFFLERQCVERFELPPAVPGSKPFVVEPGMVLFIPEYSIQNDPKNFENPEKFDPERFLGDGKRLLSSAAFMPFGMGPRMCVGKKFSLIQSKVLLFHLLARCDVKCCSKTSTPIATAKGVLSYMARDGFWVRIEPREDPCELLQNSLTNES